MQLAQLLAGQSRSEVGIVRLNQGHRVVAQLAREPPITWLATSFGDKRRGTLSLVAALKSPNLTLGYPERGCSSTLAQAAFG
ncbi:MAG TPA: hypothetical protein VFN67_31455 [Polyangiales bacterium]|nr:hypothetical protein [Polyangiales bacterium]